MKRRLSESEAEEEAADAAADAREAGMRAFRHWKDRGEPPAVSEAVAMRQACPFHDAPRRSAFFEAWKRTGGTLFDHVWVGSKFPEREGQSCRVLTRLRSRVEVEFADGERMPAQAWWVRRKSA